MRRVNLQHPARIHGAHDGELQQVVGPAVDVGPHVQQHHWVRYHRRQHHRDGGPVHPGNATQSQQRCSHRRPGMAGTDDGIRAAVADQFHRHDDGRPFLAPYCHRRRFVHLYHLRRIDDGESGGYRPVARHLSFHAGLRPYQHDLRPKVAHRRDRPRDDNVWGVIPAHGVDCDPHCATRRSWTVGE